MSDKMNGSVKKKRASKIPFTSLRECEELTQKIFKSIGKREASTKEISHAFGMSENSSGFMQLMASLRMFGLIERSEGKVALSERGLRITAPTKPDQPKEALREAFLECAFYKQLLDKYSGGPLPEETFLQNDLIG